MLANNSAIYDHQWQMFDPFPLEFKHVGPMLGIVQRMSGQHWRTWTTLRSTAAPQFMCGSIAAAFGVVAGHGNALPVVPSPWPMVSRKPVGWEVMRSPQVTGCEGSPWSRRSVMRSPEPMRSPWPLAAAGDHALPAPTGSPHGGPAAPAAVAAGRGGRCGHLDAKGKVDAKGANGHPGRRGRAHTVSRGRLLQLRRVAQPWLPDR